MLIKPYWNNNFRHSAHTVWCRPEMEKWTIAMFFFKTTWLFFKNTLNYSCLTYTNQHVTHVHELFSICASLLFNSANDEVGFALIKLLFVF